MDADAVGREVWRQFRAACRAGRVKEARALVAEHGLLVDGPFEAAVVCAAGIDGHLCIAQWVVTELGLNLHGWAGDRIFVRGCEFGHLHACQWLTEYGFQPHDRIFSSGDKGVNVIDRGLMAAVTHGHWAVARWLVSLDARDRAWPVWCLAALKQWSPTRDAWMRSVLCRGIRAEG